MKQIITKSLKNWLEIIGGGTLGALSICVFISVVFRSVLKIGIPWMDEIVQMLFEYLVFFGAALGVKYNSHFTVDFLGIFPIRIQKVLISINYVVTILFVIVFTGSSWNYTINSIGTISQSLSISLAWTNIVLPISGVLMVYYFIRRWIIEIINWKKESGKI
ncbi:TRAP transporter small permease [Sporolactobacillus vineae]|uniref:TRAP transporter small permease n=1 Tax=Sporolactobacillus vineae TaxID=444463 RepID=UPI000382AFEA|nr:TRAP transporter small permease [Sporolactobacillus vineae]